jgi:ElaB/YqjD/DUF883 family membrane-anchored ribosome-binding protein
MPARGTETDNTVDLATLKADLDRLRDDLATFRRQLGGAATERMEGLRETLRERATAGVDEIGQELDRLTALLGAQGEAGLAGVNRLVRERPLTSLLAAFGLGMLIGRLTEGRRR